MEVRIGVQHVARELVIDSPDSTDGVTTAVSAALTGESKILSLDDERGRRVVVPADATVASGPHVVTIATRRR